MCQLFQVAKGTNCTRGKTWMRSPYMLTNISASYLACHDFSKTCSCFGKIVENVTGLKRYILCCNRGGKEMKIKKIIIKHKQNHHRHSSKHGHRISFPRYYNLASGSLEDDWVSHDDNNRQNWAGMALLQKLNMEGCGGRGLLISSRSIQSAKGRARSFPPSCLRSYLGISRFCSEPLDIDVF